jgi:23S rRNA pseudouridine1911/1915/1917 synthase
MADELSSELVHLTVEARAHGWRTDHYLCRLYPNYSRALFQRSITQGNVTVNGLPTKAGRRLRVNDQVAVRLPEIPDSTLPAENIPLNIVFEDDAIIVINKPPDMIVHPGKGNYHGTLAGALQYHFDQLSDVAGKLRPGVVHRLDRDTSGVLVVAKDNQVHHRLSGQFERREVKKQYRALVWKKPEFDSDYIETHMRVHRKQREKMTVCEPGNNAREASTFYEVLERFDGFAYVALHPKTGRTHQLRVHMQHIGHSIVADRLYGGGARLRLTDVQKGRRAQPNAPIEGEDAADRSLRQTFIHRQALHAFRLRFRHPQSDEPMEFEASLPDDFQAALDALRKHAQEKLP